MTLERLNEMLNESINGAEIRPHAMKQTNILNAEYASGECMAILNIIKELFGLDAFIAAYDRTRTARDTLLERTQEIYK